MSNIMVIGAGIVGMASALALLDQGHDVTVIDRLPPGEACSFGNSGGMPRSHAFPMATPGILWKVPGYLWNPLGPLAIRWSKLPHLAPWLTRFVQASTAQRFAHSLGHLTSLMQESYESWTALLERTDSVALVRQDGALTLYRSEAAREAAWPSWAMLVARGANIDRVDRDRLAVLEPAAPDGYVCAVHEPDYRRTIDPHALTCAIAASFVASGGTILREAVNEVEATPGGPVMLRTNRAQHMSDTVVIAAGAWSNQITAHLGYPVPLEAARGYHVTLLDPGIMPQHAMFISDLRFSLTPMQMGLRMGGNIEFAGLDSAPNFRRPARQIELLRRIYPTIRTSEHTKWSGERPATPDSLPVIGRLPRHPNIICAFGHGQYGLALAAVTGKLVAGMVAGDEPGPAALSITRFK